jgi:hypothetical protein
MKTIEIGVLLSVTGGRQLGNLSLGECLAAAGPEGAKANAVNLQGVQPKSFSGDVVNDGLERVRSVNWQGAAGGLGNCVVKDHAPR